MTPLKPREVAKRLNVSESYVRKWVKAGRFPRADLPGSALRIDWDEFCRQMSRAQQRRTRSLKTEKKLASSPYHQKGDMEWLD